MTSATKPLKGLNILVVEDNFLIALDTADELESAGASVAMAANSQEALKLAGCLPIAGAVLDVDLDGETSAPVAERLSASNIPFLFYTGRPQRPDFFGRFPHAAVLAKPFHPKDVVHRLQAIVNDADTGETALAATG